MYNTFQTLPMVYLIKKDKDGSYFLEPHLERFEIPTRLYGNTRKIATRIWNTYIRLDKSLGAMFTGHSGSGKTLVGEIMSNYAIDSGISVVKVTNIEVDINLIAFIAGLPKRIVIFLDEFTKNFNHAIQDKMLTMLSDTALERLYILTENDVAYINNYIRNRPGRVRYHIRYDRIDKSVIEDYCNEFKVSPEFYTSLMDKYNVSVTFSFDHLQALVSEHLLYPNETLDEQLEIMNLDILSKNISFTVQKVIDVDGNELALGNSRAVDFSTFERARSYVYINASVDGKFFNNIRFDNSMITDITGNVYTIVTPEKYTLTFVKE